MKKHFIRENKKNLLKKCNENNARSHSIGIYNDFTQNDYHLVIEFNLLNHEIITKNCY